MKVHSLTIIHYGKDYLSYALQSIYHNVDYCHIFYTPTPSHGHSVDISPIETKLELQQAAYAYDPDNKIKWYDTLDIRQEGQQRDLALSTVQNTGADVVLVLDYDEVWFPGVLNSYLSYIQNKGTARNYLINMVHFWRSFNWVCRDQGWPVRLIDLRCHKGLEYLDTSVYHFGYAITDNLMRYKWQIHGHKNELRSNWINDIWPKWPSPNDCHPTNEKGFWSPEPFDKTQLPDFMKSHPFYDLEKIT